MNIDEWEMRVFLFLNWMCS